MILRQQDGFWLILYTIQFGFRNFQTLNASQSLLLTTISILLVLSVLNTNYQYINFGNHILSKNLSILFLKILNLIIITIDYCNIKLGSIVVQGLFLSYREIVQINYLCKYA